MVVLSFKLIWRLQQTSALLQAADPIPV